MQSGDKRRRTLIQVGVAVVLIALIAVIGFSVVSKDDASNSAAPAATPSAVTDGGAIRLGNPDATVVVSVVEDFQCPVCKQFEALSGQTLQDLIAGGTVAVDYQPIAILDRMSSTKFSTRAANASMCVAQNDKDRWLDWHTAMFDGQPAEGGAGLSDDDLVSIAATAGASSPETSSCITDGTYSDWVTTQTQTVLGEGVTGTPTVTVNGTQVASPTPDNILAAVNQAGA